MRTFASSVRSPDRRCWARRGRGPSSSCTAGTPGAGRLDGSCAVRNRRSARASCPRIRIVSVPRSSDFRKPGGGIAPRFERPVAETALASARQSAGGRAGSCFDWPVVPGARAGHDRAGNGIDASVAAQPFTFTPSFRSPEVRRFSTNRAFLTSPHRCNAFVRMSNAVRTVHCNVIRLIEQVCATVQYSGK
jgi:hypothetical protein